MVLRVCGLRIILSDPIGSNNIGVYFGDFVTHRSYLGDDSEESCQGNDALVGAVDESVNVHTVTVADKYDDSGNECHDDHRSADEYDGFAEQCPPEWIGFRHAWGESSLASIRSSRSDIFCSEK